MQKRYAVFPGWVYSKTDGDRHWISAGQLMQLYGVAPGECFIVSSAYADGHRGRMPEGLIKLFPSYDGDYDLSKRKATT